MKKKASFRLLLPVLPSNGNDFGDVNLEKLPELDKKKHRNKRWTENIDLNLVEGMKVISFWRNIDFFLQAQISHLFLCYETSEIKKSRYYWKGVERNYFFQSAESTGTDLFTVRFAMFAWTKDWKENTNADRILDTMSVVFVWR